MNLKKNTNCKKVNKRGSYIVEGALLLPILILSICALALTIKVIEVCEDICFTTAQEVLKIDLGAYKFNNSVSLCNDMEEKISKANLTSFEITRFKYLYNQNQMTDLIAVDAEGEFNVTNPIGIGGQIHFGERLLTRGFTGTIQEGTPLSLDEFCGTGASYKVKVYPKYGERYHTKNCIYVKQSKEDGDRKIEMQKEDALRKGYTACKKCGGAANV